MLKTLKRPLSRKLQSNNKILDGKIKTDGIVLKEAENSEKRDESVKNGNHETTTNSETKI